MAHCELCRTETDATVLYGGLCSVCEPWWNLVRDLVERTPSWQIEAMDDAAAMTDLERVRDNGIEANDEGWAEILSWFLPDSSTDSFLDGWSDDSVLSLLTNMRSVLDENSPLFDAEASLRPCKSRKVFIGPCRLNGHHIQTTSVGLDVGDWTLTYGPGHLLLRLILGDGNDPGGRFVRLMKQLMGMNGIDLRSITDRMELRKDQLWIQDIRLPGAVRPFILEAIEWPEDPPFNYTPDGFHITILDENRKRHVLRLPHSPRAIEAFSAIWNGRDGPDLARRLRGLTMAWAIDSGNEDEGEVANPTERSFYLLRSVVDGAPGIWCDRGHLRIAGSSGVHWRISPGIGAHGAPYIIRPVAQTPGGNEVLFREICAFDAADELPLGDRICTVALGLLNDEEIRHQIFTINAAIRKVLRYTRPVASAAEGP